MIYEEITKEINNYLGEDFLISYANNHDTKWDKILPDVQSELKYGVVRVDSGQTTQTGGMPIRIEQLRLIVAIPEDRLIFDAAVANLRSLITNLNNTTITTTEDGDNITAILFFDEYHDAQSSTVNGNRWWIAEVTFMVNYFNTIINSDDVSITVNGNEIHGIISATYLNEKTVDGYVYNNAPTQQNSINGIRKQLTINLIYIKDDPIFHTENNQGILDNEDNISKTWSIVYNNGIKSRTMTMFVATVNETMISADTLKATITFATA